jgi:hypothetical protein
MISMNNPFIQLTCKCLGKAGFFDNTWGGGVGGGVESRKVITSKTVLVTMHTAFKMHV